DRRVERPHVLQRPRTLPDPPARRLHPARDDGLRRPAGRLPGAAGRPRNRPRRTRPARAIWRRPQPRPRLPPARARAAARHRLRLPGRPRRAAEAGCPGLARAPNRRRSLPRPSRQGPLPAQLHRRQCRDDLAARRRPRPDCRAAHRPELRRRSRRRPANPPPRPGPDRPPRRAAPGDAGGVRGSFGAGTVRQRLHETLRPRPLRQGTAALPRCPAAHAARGRRLRAGSAGLGRRGAGDRRYPPGAPPGDGSRQGEGWQFGRAAKIRL
ncbi:MAG: hypothetical protein AVDCRST_MAG18-377, partial [uncultured Thermomicrobiales bacterium]